MSSEVGCVRGEGGDQPVFDVWTGMNDWREEV